MSAIFLGLGLIIASTFAQFYSRLYFRAAAFNEAQALAVVDPAAQVLTYDNCNSGSDTVAVSYENDTNWTIMYRFNMVVYSLFSGMLFCSFGGLVYSKLLQATLSCLQITGLVHLVALLLIAVLRFNSNGLACASNASEYDDDGNSFESDSMTTKALFIAQCSLFIPFCACTCIGYFKGSQPQYAK